MHFKKIIFLLVFPFSTLLGKETDPVIEKAILELEKMYSLVVTAEDVDKVAANELFKSRIRDFLRDPKTLDYDLTALKSVSVLTGPKNKFRIYTWPLEIAAGSYDYYGFTQCLINKKLKQVRVVELKNAIFEMNHQTDQQYGPDEWRGALYYDLIPSKKKNKKFVLLGWDGHDNRSTKKIIEVISFNRKGEPTFGAPIIRYNIAQGKQTKFITEYRHIFEYSNKVSMMLRYDKDLKMIVFDHLAPINEKLKSIKATYVPDFSYDGLYKKKGKWYMKKQLDLRNKSLPKPKKYKPSDYQ